MKFPYIPKELINIILEFDGRIIYKNGRYQINTDNKMYISIKQNIKNKKFILNIIPADYRTLLSIKKIERYSWSGKLEGYEKLEFVSIEKKPYYIHHHIIRMFNRNNNINILIDGGKLNFYQQYVYY